jgi:hypothetical protein
MYQRMDAPAYALVVRTFRYSQHMSPTRQGTDINVCSLKVDYQEGAQ